MNLPNPAERYGYIAYVDEAGDFGLRNVSPIDRSGASEWLILSAVVIRAEKEGETVAALRQARLMLVISNLLTFTFARLMTVKRALSAVPWQIWTFGSLW
jgi:hypothetical protein